MNKKVTYANFIFNYWPFKSQPYRVRLTVGGNQLDCEFNTGYPDPSLLETNITINSTISDVHEVARFVGVNLKEYFSDSPINSPEFMYIRRKCFPGDISKQYNIDAISDADGYLYIRIKKSMYGLKQSAVIAYNIFSATTFNPWIPP